MKKFELIAPCHFGLEAVLKKEIYDLGYEIVKVEDGRVTYEGDEEAVCRSNIFLRTAERVLLKVGSFTADTFEEFYQGIYALPWERYIPVDGKFWVKKASSVKSALFSASDIQSVAKKAMADRMRKKYGADWFEEDGAEYPVRIFVYKDEVTAALDTTGESLHKRGYRQLVGKAPLSETLAAALILLTPWRPDRILVDPLCGCGTFPIEAAMIAARIAPGMKRHFLSESWDGLIGEDVWDACFAEAEDMVDTDVSVDIQGYDIDADIVAAARENARRAGVGHMIHLQQRAVKDLRHPKKYGFILTNPPYGERLEDKELLRPLYEEIGAAYRALDDWSMYLLTAYGDAQACIGRRADKNRKIYNGMMKTYFYQFFGPKPPKRKKPPVTGSALPEGGEREADARL